MTNDFDGERRPRGAGADIGADEFSTNIPPVINRFLQSGSNWVVTFTSLPGLSYDLQRASEVNGGVWSLVATNVPGAGSAISITNAVAIGVPRQFYRVRLSP